MSEIKTEIKLTKSQEIVFNKILDFIYQSADRAFVLKGYAGTGKTTLMRFLIDDLMKKKRNFKLLVSTGRAAKILSDATGHEEVVSTIHSLIYSFNPTCSKIPAKYK